MANLKFALLFQMLGLFLLASTVVSAALVEEIAVPIGVSETFKTGDGKEFQANYFEDFSFGVYEKGDLTAALVPITGFEKKGDGLTHILDCKAWYECSLTFELTVEKEFSFDSKTTFQGTFKSSKYGTVSFEGIRVKDKGGRYSFVDPQTYPFEAGKTYTVQFVFHRTNPKDEVDLVPVLYGVELKELAIWDANGNTFQNDNSIGTIVWVAPENAQVSDNIYANSSLTLLATSNYLKVTNFGFRMPPEATINGVIANIERKGSGLNLINDSNVTLVKNNLTTGTGKVNSSNWGTSDAFSTYGGYSDLWGTTLTGTNVRNSSFGVAISAFGVGIGVASVDYINLSVNWTDTSGNVSACSDLTTTGRTYNLTQNITFDNLTSTCMQITAPNITLDCKGFVINGNSTYGVYSNQSNTTIKNCRITNFEYGIFYEGSTNGTIQNDTVSATVTGIQLDTGSNGARILLSNSNATTFGIQIYSTNNTLINQTNISTGGSGIAAIKVYDSNFNNFTHTYGTGAANGIDFDGGSTHNIVLFSRFEANGTDNGAYLSFDSGFNTLNYSNFSTSASQFASVQILSDNNTVTNCRLVAESGLDLDDAEFNTIINNTIIATEASRYSVLITTDEPSFNSIINNNLTGTQWISNDDTTTIFNNSNSGNAYYFANGTPSWNVFRIYDMNGNGYADVALDGSLPFNVTTVGGNWSGVGEDFHPFTSKVLIVHSTTLNYSTVLFVNNTNSTESGAILTYFFLTRNITNPNVVNVSMNNVSFNITHPVLNSTLLQPVKVRLQSLEGNGTAINYIVLTRGIPYAVMDGETLCSQNSSTTVASVDMELTLINTAFENSIGGQGAVTNPAFQQTGYLTKARFGFYGVTRLDDSSLTGALSLIDRGGSLQNVTTGQFIMNQQTGQSSINSQMSAAGSLWNAAGYNRTVGSTSQWIVNQPNVSYYQSFGSNTNSTNRGAPNNTFLNGSVGSYLYSFSGMNNTGTTNPCGTNGSIIGDLINEGVTMAFATVHEPFTNGEIRSNQFATSTLAGTPTADSIFQSVLSMLSWQGVIYGDPLMPWTPEWIGLNFNSSLQTNTLINTCTSNLSLNVSSNFGITNLTYSINNGSNTTTTNFNLVIPLSSFTSGNNTIHFHYVDSRGVRSQEINQSYNFNYTTTDTQPNIIAPIAQTYSFNGSSNILNITWDYANATGNEVFQIELYNGTWAPLAQTGHTYYEWNVTNVPSSSYTVRVYLITPNISCTTTSGDFNIVRASAPVVDSSVLTPSTFNPLVDTLTGYCAISNWAVQNGYFPYNPQLNWSLFKNGTLNQSGSFSEGLIQTPVGSLTSGYLEGVGTGAEFAYLTGAASNGNILYLSDADNGVIRQVDLVTLQTSLIAGDPGNFGYQEGIGTNALFQYTIGLAYHGGILYVIDSDNDVVRGINLTTNQTFLIAGDPGVFGYAEGVGTNANLAAPFGAAFGPDGFLYFTDYQNSAVRKVNVTSNETFLVAGNCSSSFCNFGYQEGIGDDAIFGNPQGLTFGPDGYLYVADTCIIRKINITSNETFLVAGDTGTLCGQIDGIGDQAQFYYPFSLVFANDGFLYVGSSDSLRKINVTTNETSYVAGVYGTNGIGDGLNAQAGFLNIYGISEVNQTLYLADETRIRNATEWAGIVWGNTHQVVSLNSSVLASGQTWVLQCLVTDGVNLDVLNSNVAVGVNPASSASSSGGLLIALIPLILAILLLLIITRAELTIESLVVILIIILVVVLLVIPTILQLI